MLSLLNRGWGRMAERLCIGMRSCAFRRKNNILSMWLGVVARKLLEAVGDSQIGAEMIHAMDGTARPHPSRRRRETALPRHQLA
jgi:hypothetical protein